MAQANLPNLGSKPSFVWAVLLIVFGFLAISLPVATSFGVVIVVAWLIVFRMDFISSMRSDRKVLDILSGSSSWRFYI